MIGYLLSARGKSGITQKDLTELQDKNLDEISDWLMPRIIAYNLKTRSLEEKMKERKMLLTYGRHASRAADLYPEDNWYLVVTGETKEKLIEKISNYWLGIRPEGKLSNIDVFEFSIFEHEDKFFIEWDHFPDGFTWSFHQDDLRIKSLRQIDRLDFRTDILESEYHLASTLKRLED